VYIIIGIYKETTFASISSRCWMVTRQHSKLFSNKRNLIYEHDANEQRCFLSLNFTDFDLRFRLCA